LAESLERATEFVSKHKAALGVAGAAVVLWLLLRGGSSSGASSSGGGSAAQIAQLQAAQNVQMAQLQAQQNAQVLGAQVQQNNTNAALEATQSQLEEQLAEAGLSANVQNTKTTSTLALYKDLIDTGAKQQQEQLSAESTLASQIIPKLNSQHYKDTYLNALALVTGQGNIGSYNQATSSEQIASDLSQASIVNGITGAVGSVGKSGGGLLSSLF